MEPERIEMIVPADRKLDLSGLPVDPGERVEIILLHNREFLPTARSKR